MTTPIRQRAPRRTISQPKEIDLENVLERVGRVPEELRAGVAARQVGGPWIEGLPRYVWHRAGDTVVEFRLADPARARYARYELHPSEWPEGVV